MQFQQAREFIIKKLTDELPGILSYHSIHHTLDVYDACVSIAASEGIDGEELLLLLTAALFHDAGFLIRSEGHEQLSCEIAQNYLPGFGYTRSQVETICSMIMATRLPQSPKNKTEEILCDADLDYLGRDDFYQVGNRLFNEFSTDGIVKTKEEWDRVQLKFLQSHSYFTGTAIKLRKQKKDVYLQQIRSKVETCS